MDLDIWKSVNHLFDRLIDCYFIWTRSEMFNGAFEQWKLSSYFLHFSHKKKITNIMMNHLQTCCSMPLQWIPFFGGKIFNRFYWIERIQSIVGLACVSIDTRISWNIHVMHRKILTGTRARIKKKTDAPDS